MSGVTLCIDFGSTRTKVAHLDPASGKPALVELGREVRAVIPTVFYLPKGEGSILVGDDAMDLVDTDPAGVVTDIKREIQRPGKLRCGAGRLAPERWELAAELFSTIRRRCQEEVFHRQSVDGVVLTVPVCFNQQQRDKLQQAAQKAGFAEVRLQEEPVAAAMHWLACSGAQISPYVIVVDIGGGTTDLAALKLENGRYVPVADLPPVGFLEGGNDIDAQLRAVLLEALPAEAERSGGWLARLRPLKEWLGRERREMYRVQMGSQPVEIPRDVIEQSVREFAARVQSKAGTFVEDFTELTDNRDCPILLAGGGSRLAGMKEAIEASTPVAMGRVMLWNDGEFAIVKGGLLRDAPAVATPTPSRVPPQVQEQFKREPVEARTAPKRSHQSSVPVTNVPVPATEVPVPEATSREAVAQLREVLDDPATTIESKNRRITFDMVQACRKLASAGDETAQRLLTELEGLPQAQVRVAAEQQRLVRQAEAQNRATEQQRRAQEEAQARAETTDARAPWHPFAQRVPCTRCGAMILQQTAQSYNGLCAPCAQEVSTGQPCADGRGQPDTSGSGCLDNALAVIGFAFLGFIALCVLGAVLGGC